MITLFREKIFSSFAIKLMISLNFSYLIILENIINDHHHVILSLLLFSHLCSVHSRVLAYQIARTYRGIRATRRPSTNIVMWVMNGRALNKHGGCRSYLKLRARICKWRHLFRRSFAAASLFLRISRASFRFRGGQTQAIVWRNVSFLNRRRNTNVSQRHTVYFISFYY